MLGVTVRYLNVGIFQSQCLHSPSSSEFLLEPEKILSQRGIIIFYFTILHPHIQTQDAHDIVDIDIGVRESMLAEGDLDDVFHQIDQEQRKRLDLEIAPQHGRVSSHLRSLCL